MKTIGMLGGMTPISTTLYYEQINRQVNERLGANHSAKILLSSMDFEPLVQMQRKSQWREIGTTLSENAQSLESIGADFIVLATDTMHKVAPIVRKNVKIPLLSIVDTTAAAIKAAGLHTVALLGTRFTMQDMFYRDRLEEEGIHCLVPDDLTQHELHSLIFDELALGKITPATRRTFRVAINALYAQGAEGVILGCTELSIAISPETSPLPIFDSTDIHIKAIVDYALK